MGYSTGNRVGHRVGPSANESVGSCVTVPHRSPLRHINERVQGKMVEVRGLVHTQAAENSDNKCEEVDRQIAPSTSPTGCRWLIAPLRCEHPCRSISHIEVADTVPGDVI